MPKMPIDSQKERFELVFSQNRRIVFSAPYGAGKSYFINEFFKEKKGWQNIVIHPLNYQTCGNDDVFQLLQRDVLVTLCANNPDIINNTKDQKLGAIVRAAHVFFDNLSADSSFASNIAPPLLIKSIYALKKLKEVFTTDELSEACGEYGTVQGEIKETNPLSELICYYIERLHNHGKHICLTIDDFDRMDPGQIFRLLNVFSTCVYDNEDNANRFGLDKIILVCDIDNIKKIYHHLYGDADFHSYISKFAPIQPFRYSIVEEYPAYISDLMGEAFCKNYPSVSKLLSERIVSSTSDIRRVESSVFP